MDRYRFGRMETIMIQIRFYGQNNRLLDSGYTNKQEEEIYDEQLVDLLANTRWYLDNLEFMRTYRVSWKNYKEGTATPPKRFCKTHSLIKKSFPYKELENA